MKKLVKVKDDISITGFYGVHYFEFNKYHKQLPETHDYWEMVYVDKGRVVVCIDGQNKTMEEGQAIFHKPGELHAHNSNKRVSNNILVVSFASTAEPMKFFAGKVFTLDKTSKNLLLLFMQETEKATGSISNDYNDNSPLEFSSDIFGSSQLMQFHFVEFLIKLLRTSIDTVTDTLKARPSGENLLIEEIIAYLKNNVYNSVTLGDVCDNFFVRKSRLSVLFKENTGKSPMRFYADLKIEEAKNLLRDDAMSVSEIADKLKYSGIHNFSRAFKESTGFSPSGYKKSILSFK